MAAVQHGVLDLYQLHVKLKAVQDQLQMAPKQIKARQQLSAAKLAEAESAKERLKKLRSSADQNNLQVKMNETKIAGLKGKLNQSASNREFDALRSQIEADEMANSVLEDEVLAAYEKLDRLKEEIAQIEAEVVTLRAAETKLAQDLAAAEPGLKKQVVELQQQIKVAEEIIPSDLRLAYGRMVQSTGPNAFAEVEGNQCLSCFVSLPPQTLRELNAGKVVTCKSCSKIMFVQ